MSGYSATYHSFSERPDSDSCWSLHTGPDGRIYAAACCEHLGGETVTVTRYDEETDSIQYLFDMDKVTGDLRDSGRATQCKIHYSFAPSPKDGILYAATHLSGPPKGETSYNPWAGWHDPKRAFRGAYLIAFDTVKDEVIWSEVLIPKEGCRCLYLDDEHGWIYAVSYPRDHLVRFDLETRTLKDLGRISSVNTQCLFADRQKRVYLTNDEGQILRYDPNEDKIRELPHRITHASFQSGWHGVLYDAVADPTGEAIYMVPWMSCPHLMRFLPDEGPDGRLEDLGTFMQERSLTHPVSMSLEHMGGLVFGIDGRLYFAKAIWPVPEENEPGFFSIQEATSAIVALDTTTLESEEVCRLEREDGPSHYVSRGGRDARGNLYFGSVLQPPVGLFRVTVPGAGSIDNAHLPLRMWG